MLEFFRKNVGGMLGIIIVGLLVFAFSFTFGSQSQGWGKGQSKQASAKVNGDDITESVNRYAFRLMGGSRLSDDAQIATLKKHALNGLIDRQLLLSMAEDLGVSASSEEVLELVVKGEIYVTRSLESIMAQIEQPYRPMPQAEIILRSLVDLAHRTSIPVFDQDGKFKVEDYENYVKGRLQMTGDGFIEQQRLELIAKRVRQIIVNSVRISEEEVRAVYNNANDTASIKYVRFIPSAFAESLKPTGIELDAWAAAHEDEIKQYYNNNIADFKDRPKTVRARQILAKIEGEDKTAAQAKIDGVLALIKAGDDFATLATEHSEDEATAAKGGDLGFVARGEKADLDKVLFSKAVGDISDVIETDSALIIVKIEELKEGDVPAEEANQQIAKILHGQIVSDETAKAKADEFLSKLKAGGTMADLVSAHNEAGIGPELNAGQSAQFSASDKNIVGVGKSSEIIAAIFALKAEQTLLDKVFKIGKDYFVAGLEERIVPNDEDFAKEKSALTSELLAKKQIHWLRTHMAKLRDKADIQAQVYVNTEAKDSDKEAGKREQVKVKLDAPKADDNKEADKPSE